MPFETQVVIGAIILVFAFFMVLVAWAERRAGGRFDDAAADAGRDHPAPPTKAEPASEADQRQVA